VVASLAVLVTSATGFAQPATDPMAAQLKLLGDTAIETGRYQEALEAYSKALSITPTPALHYNRGRALQALGRHADALDEFELFEKTASPELKAAVPELNAMVERTRAQVTEIELICEVRGATLHVGQQAFELPLKRKLRIDAASIDASVDAPGYDSWKRHLTLVGGERRVITAVLEKSDQHGTLTIASPVAGASVQIDGKAAGAVPIETRLVAGEHTIALTHPDYQVTVTHVVVRARERRTVSISLSKAPQIYERWWFWTGVGTAVVAGVVTGIALSTEKSPSKGDIPPGQIKAGLVSF
jgi:hypothetical protein